MEHAPARSEAAAHAAQAVFQAKQPVIDEANRNRGMMWATVIVIAVIVAAAGAYVWIQMRPLAQSVPASYNTRRPPPAPVAQPASLAPHVEAPPFPISNLAPSEPSSAPAAVAAVTPPPPRVAPAAAARRDPLKELVESPVAAAPARPAVALARSAEPRRVPADVTGAYQALRAGDLAAARRQYEAVLTRDSRALDGLLGLATVEARSGNRPAATGLYRRALEVDPRNATAFAALASLSEDARPDSLEPQLQADISRNPGQSPLRIALGNLYASQGRWNEAQSAYFDAHRLDPANADVAFNLAVALDHLGKGKLAATYYRRALEAARGQPSQFEAEAASRRAAELEALPGR
jgi:tetratricopeptide (TPR) repeat protein